MKLIKWNNPVSSYWPSFFDDEDFFSWPTISEDKGLNIYETDQNLVVEASIPGIPEDKVDVTVEGNVLNIVAKHQETEEDQKKKKTVYKSTRSSSFNYSTSLPRLVDGNKAVAEISNGVVTVTIPKSEAEKPKKISVVKK